MGSLLARRSLPYKGIRLQFGRREHTGTDDSPIAINSYLEETLPSTLGHILLTFFTTLCEILGSPGISPLDTV